MLRAIIITVLVLIPLSNADAQVSQVERNSLIALYHATDGGNWSNNTNWLGAVGTECTWHGVLCFGGRLILLGLIGNQLTGTIPPELAGLSNLETLSLEGNQLTGTIPPELAGLSNLSSLLLSDNFLTGTIPPELAQIPNLTGIFLSFNQLTGNIPIELGNISTLRSLRITQNQISGTIPPELGNLTNLYQLGLSSNQLHGSIPPEFGNLRNLKYLQMASNQLSGEIPIQFTNLTALINLDICFNQLYSNNSTVRAFLDAIQPGWEDCQDFNAVTYVALGDSYSSGEGAKDYAIDINRDGDTLDLWNGVLWENTDKEDNECHRSADSWSGLKPGGNPDASSPYGENNVNRLLVACSGAVINDLVSPYPMNHSGKNPDEIAQLEHNVVLSEADLLSLTIGGNDIGFAAVAQACLALPNALCGGWILRASNKIDHIYSDEFGLQYAYEQVKSESKPNSAVFVLGYPRILSGDALALPPCVTTGPGFDLTERQWFKDLGERLNLAISCAAEKAGVHYVPVDFSGHEACTFGNWINGMTWPLVESLHPNKRGQIAYSQALRSATRNGIPQNPNPVPTPTNPECANLESKLAINAIDEIGDLSIEHATPPACETRGSFVPGDELRIVGWGFAMGIEVTLDFYADDGAYLMQLAAATADGNGMIEILRTIPVDAPRFGDAVIIADGTNPTGGTTSLVGALKLVDSSSSDADSDGIPDICDNCPGTQNTGQEDDDGDFVGNACDDCPNDPENDWDQDEFCADVDPCPYDSENDGDGDRLCAENDNCPDVYNPGQEDLDGDLFGDACDRVRGAGNNGDSRRWP